MMRHQVSLGAGVALLILLLLGATGGGTAWAQDSGKKLIELGWDIPDTAYIRQNIAQMEQSPFDGTVFFAFNTRPDGKKSNLSRLAWGRTPIPADAVQGPIQDLQATKFQKFSDNFLRVDMMPGDIDWFDDYSSVVQNMKLMAKIAHDGGAKGIFLDTEQYGGRGAGYLFTYDRQRNRATKSLDEYNAQARKRGRDVMIAMQEAFPGLTVFVTFGRSHAIATKGNMKPSSGIQYDLLPGFFDGLVDGASDSASIVDGFELSYRYRSPAQFEKAYQIIKQDAAAESAYPDKYRKYVSAGFGIWLDADWQKRGWDGQTTTANYYQPDELQNLVQKALEMSDKYVWIYSQKPNWWKKQNVPHSYVEALSTAKKSIKTNN